MFSKSCIESKLHFYSSIVSLTPHHNFFPQTNVNFGLPKAQKCKIWPMRSNELCYQLKPSLTHQEIKIIREKSPEAESPYFLTIESCLILDSNTAFCCFSCKAGYAISSSHSNSFKSVTGYQWKVALGPKQPATT